MPRTDEAHRLTDRSLAILERRIARIYGQASKDVQEKVAAYFTLFEKRDAEMKAKLDAGEITKEYYKQWRLAQMGRGKRFEALRDRLAERMTKANETAAAYMNDATPGIYSLNRNYAAYTIEQVSDDVDFTLWDEQTVKRLIDEQPDLMPYYPQERAVNRGIDLAWGKQQITAQITSGILQGESIKHLADRLQKNIPDMNRTSAIRAARTATTGAQNAGRMDSYVAAEKMGIKLKKQWIATLDGRTRHEHAMLDGQIVPRDKPFVVEGYRLMFPGDPSGAPEMIYNCRCTMVSALDGVDASSAARRARDPVTGRNEVISNMTYSEWMEWKREQYGDEAVDAAIKRIKNEVGDAKQFGNYKEQLGKDAPKTLVQFKNIKYNNSDEYKTLKSMYRYKGRVPEATRSDFEKYQAVKATGVIGTVRVPPYPIDAGKLSFNDEHAAEHGCTENEARGFVRSAYCSITRKRWDGLSTNYYSKDGAAYVDSKTMKIKASFPRSQYDPKTKAVVGVFE